jgi:class 3 adenylate cyclase
MDSRTPSATATPTVVRTFVLGDMVASTRLWERHADRMPEVLARVDDLVESHLLVWDGHRPAEQGEGDNFVAAFARPAHAVGFAAALQAAFCARA